ncbi:hypothetical protein GBO30_06820 [Elizabethkingia anophelis]|uniref:hypothetical protein n=1 Tax=Elizabethkingia anophelis TaxID=1117645 RepID=UPI0018C1EFF0|nr:hypothetical protein [Elizabethkingia anophelis]MBG0504952.1 hypothetical protein [Elizabethkingia anophelis]MCT4251702.1 hypothetical protein [Elizabethkingia anophelis]
MKKIVELIYLFFAIAIMVGIGFFLFKTTQILFLNIDKINANLFVAIIGASVTFTGYFLTRYFERKKIVEIEIRNKKIPIYEEFFEFYFRIMFQEKNKKEITTEEIIDFFRSFNQKAIIWFPDEILKGYIDWKNNLIKFSNKDIELKDIILYQEEFMKKIRKDIGQSNKTLNNWDISSLYINDLDNFK